MSADFLLVFLRRHGRDVVIGVEEKHRSTRDGRKRFVFIVLLPSLDSSLNPKFSISS